MCQEQICPQIPHMPINSCKDMRQLFQYIYLIWIHYNQQYDLEHWYMYISHYWHMSLNKHAYHIKHVCPTALILYSTCRPHITAPTRKKLKLFIYPDITNKKYIPQMLHMPITTCAHMRQLSVYLPHMNHCINNITTNTGIYIFHTLLAHAQAIMPPTLHMHVTNEILLFWQEHLCVCGANYCKSAQDKWLMSPCQKWCHKCPTSLKVDCDVFQSN